MSLYILIGNCVFFSSRRRHTRCALVAGVQTCALPIFCIGQMLEPVEQKYPLSAQAQLSDSLLQTRERVPGFEKLVRIGRRNEALIKRVVPLARSASGEPRAIA